LRLIIAVFCALIYVAPAFAVELVVGNNIIKASILNEWGSLLPNPSLSLVSKNQQSITLRASSPGYRSEERVVSLEEGKSVYRLRFELLDPVLAMDLRDYSGNKVKFVVDSDQLDVNYPKVYGVLITLLEDNFDDFLFYQVRLTLNDKEVPKPVVRVGKYMGYRQILVYFNRKALDSKLNDLTVEIPRDDQAISVKSKVQTIRQRKFEKLHR